jgi:hypothetical protein
MASVTIENVVPQRKPHAIFVSAGDRETFASFALDRLAEDFDILIFYYGTSAAKRSRFSRDATLFAAGAGSKFNALKEIQRQIPALLPSYRTVWVCDDDVQPEYGDVRMLPAISIAFGIKVLSPAHSRKGRISHEIMVPKIGRHLFRYTTFVETTCPLFAAADLVKFLDAYGATHGGYGDDWWFLNALQADKSAAAAIVDAVTIVNPHHAQKPGGHCEIELLGGLSERRARWEEAKARFNLRVWEQRNLDFVFPDEFGVTQLPREAAVFRRRLLPLIRTFFAELNYQIRFYKLRKRLAKRLTWGGG